MVLVLRDANEQMDGRSGAAKLARAAQAGGHAHPPRRAWSHHPGEQNGTQAASCLTALRNRNFNRLLDLMSQPYLDGVWELSDAHTSSALVDDACSRMAAAVRPAFELRRR